MQPKLIAFHLPQFHPIPENDAWWGKGFTEWTNVTKATPRFPGHHQPQLPSDLGFYDLRLPEVRAAQADLAREYGIYGFCYYHYWFNGKRLLERPFEEILVSGKPDFPFCLCWANENWTRRWDGAEQEVLIGQNYNDDDDREHIQYLIKAFRDPRYIRIDGKPLILIYRARHLPDPKRSLTIWRNEARKAGIGELFICRVENFFNERDNPYALGFDASVDFQPDWMAINDDNPSVVLPDGHFVVDYRNLVETELARPEVPHLRFPGVTPSWDNSARRKKNAFVIADSTPEAYEHWLTETLRRIADRPESHQLVFINAWNEWAEGNHLEPDQRYGRSYLEATRNALQTALEGPGLKTPPLVDPLKHDSFVLRDAYSKWFNGLKINKPTAVLHDQRLTASQPPRVRIILDATQCDDEALQRSLTSIAGQLYEHWQLDVLSHRPAPPIASNRLCWHTIEVNQASAVTRQLITQIGENWITLLSGGDALAEEALLLAAQTLIDAHDVTLAFTDGDVRASTDGTIETWLAPGCNPDWLRSTMKIGGLVVARKSIMLEALQDIGDSPTNALPLAATLRALEQNEGRDIRHLPCVLLNRIEINAAIPLGFRAELLQIHLHRQGQSAQIENGLIEDSLRLKYEYDSSKTRLAIAIPRVSSRESLLRSVEGILNYPSQFPVTILLPMQPSAPVEVITCLQELAGLRSPSIRVIAVHGKSTSALANELWAATDANLLLFLGEGLIPLDANWLDSLVSNALRPEIGAVGGRILATDGSLSEGMIRLGQMGNATSPYQGLSAAYKGNGGELQLEQNCSAVSMRCLAVRREVLLKVNGFAEDRYPETHASVDLCLKLARIGLHSLWTPFSSVVSSFDTPVTPTYAPPNKADIPLLEDWLTLVPKDPYFNRQLTRHFNHPRLQPDKALARESLPWHPVPKIYALPADMAGCGEMRILSPLRALSRSCLIQGAGGTRFFGPWELAMLAPDTLVTQRIYNDIGLQWLEVYRRFANSLIVYELDDLITRIPRENQHAKDFPEDMEARLARGIGLCDRLVVSTEPLAEAYGRFALETVVVPNLLDNVVWGNLAATRRQGPRLRVGWAGSSSHGGDLAFLHDTLRTLANEVDWVFLGFCPPELRPFVREIHPAVPVQDYPKALAALGLDVAIAPLAANAFNEAKSNLKLLEYGALGYPVVCSNILPYQGNLPVVRVANTTQHWVAAIRRLLADQAERETLGSALQAEVRKHWMIDSRLNEWLSAWTR